MSTQSIDRGNTRTKRRLTQKKNSSATVCVNSALFCGQCFALTPFDLHALSTPPAFILDQDQILKRTQKTDSTKTPAEI